MATILCHVCGIRHSTWSNAWKRHQKRHERMSALPPTAPIVNHEEVNRIFDSHPPEKLEDALAHEQVTEAFKRIAITMSNLPPGRERSLVMTKLEEASFYAHACIGRNPHP